MGHRIPMNSRKQVFSSTALPRPSWGSIDPRFWPIFVACQATQVCNHRFGALLGAVQAWVPLWSWQSGLRCSRILFGLLHSDPNWYCAHTKQRTSSKVCAQESQTANGRRRMGAIAYLVAPQAVILYVSYRRTRCGTSCVIYVHASMKNHLSNQPIPLVHLKSRLFFFVSLRPVGWCMSLYCNWYDCWTKPR